MASSALKNLSINLASGNSNSAVDMPLLGTAGLFADSSNNDTARSPESIESSNIVIPADQLGNTNTAVPSFNPAPAPDRMADQLESIKQQALQIQSAINQRSETSSAEAESLDVRSQIQQGLTDMFTRDIAGESQDIRDYYNLEDKEKLSRDLNNEAIAIKRDYEAQLRDLNKNSEGKLRGALQGEINDLTEKGNLALSEKMFQYSIANGDFLQAEKLALQAIGDMEKADQRRLDLLTTAYEFVQNDLSESEKLQIQQNFTAQEAERDFERDQLMAEFNYSLGAGQRAFDNNMAQNRLSLQQAEFQAGLNTVIDRGDGNKQLINKVTGDVIATYGEGELVGVQPYSNPAQVQKAEGEISTIEALTDHKGLSKAVGVVGLARFTPFKNDVLSGEVSDFTAKVDLLTKDMTLQNLINAKAEGATFGALSDAELGLLAESATLINNWRRTKDNGDVYYKTSEKKMTQELDRIANYRKLDYVIKGGDPSSVGVQVTDDGKYWAKNTDGSMTEIIRLPDNQ